MWEAISDLIQINSKPFSKTTYIFILKIPQEYLYILTSINSLQFQNITSLVDFLNIQDTLAIQASYDFEMPAWAQPIYNNYIMPLSQLAYHSLTNSALNQVRSGVLLNEIIERLQKGANGSGENVILLTGHDINLSGLLAYLSMANQIEGKPGFASTVALELHKSWYFQNDLEIRVS